MRLKYPCITCNKNVNWNQNAILCVYCRKWIHLICSSVSSELFQSNSDWVCDACLLRQLPFYNTDDDCESDNIINGPLFFTGKEDDSDIENDIFKSLDKFNGFNIAHLNVCSLLKNIEEIRNIIMGNNFHVVTFCETRLDDSITNDDISVPGYRNLRRDRNRSGGGMIVSRMTIYLCQVIIVYFSRICKLYSPY